MCRLNRAKGSLLENCVGFIDGTVRPICKPGKEQKKFYNGHKHVHALKYQSVIFPNGIIMLMDGPYPGSRHDAGILRISGLGTLLERELRGTDQRQLYLYGDCGYPDRPYLVCPYRGSDLTPEQMMFNTTMSTLRISVSVDLVKFCDTFPLLALRIISS